MRTLLLLSGLLLGTWSMGQTAMRPSIYFQNMNFYNPAAGLQDTTWSRELSVYAKRKFVDNDDAIWKKPANVFVSYIHGNKNHDRFAMLGYVYDGYSFYTRHTLYGGYSKEWRLGEHHRISAGARAVVVLNNMDWGALYDYPGKPNKANYLAPDLDLGLRYAWRGLRAGFASRNLLATSNKADDLVVLKNQRELIFDLSYMLRLSSKFQLAPFAMLRHERNTQYDLGMHIGLFNRVDVSYAMRLMELRSIYVMSVRLTDRFRISVAGDHSALTTDTNFDLRAGIMF
jgi:hypothetical protein